MERTEPFGIDVSAYQTLRTSDGKVVLKHIDWERALAHAMGIRFVGVRAAISWGYTDPAFAYNWQALKKAHVPRSAYHVFYPNEDAHRQADHFCAVLAGDWGELPMTADLELATGAHACSKAHYSSQLRRYLERLTNNTGRIPIVYTRASFMDAYAAVQEWYNEYWWWLAQYLSNGEEHAGEPTLPKGVERWNVILHQTSQRGDAKAFGMQSAGLDYNRWIGKMGLEGFLAEEQHGLDEEGLELVESAKRIEAQSQAVLAEAVALKERLADWFAPIR
ncbi:MAG: glycoside hydrolase family 25 protein [Anaerolineae bacterium]|nr:glycoside hydrolase family 25 protein [Anaerolineae bacterium]